MFDNDNYMTYLKIMCITRKPNLVINRNAKELNAVINRNVKKVIVLS